MSNRNPLRFSALREANFARCPLFKNAKGETRHSGLDWSSSDWLVATLGEMGEAANILKKIRRGDMDVVEARPFLVQEFADTVIYLDMLAQDCGIDFYYVPFMQDFDMFREHECRRKSPFDGLPMNRIMAWAFIHMGHAGSVIESIEADKMYATDGRMPLAMNFISVLSCIDRLSVECDIDLGNAIVHTFNRKSEQLELPVTITPKGYISGVPSGYP